MKRRAFTLTELIVGLAVMSILAGVMTLSSSAVGKQTAKREAEKVAAYIQDRMRRADVTNSVVWFTVKTSINEIEVKTGKNYATATLETPPFKASGNCTYSPALKLTYPEELITHDTNKADYQKVTKRSSVTAGTGTGTYTLTVHGEDGRTYNVIIGR